MATWRGLMASSAMVVLCACPGTSSEPKAKEATSPVQIDKQAPPSSPTDFTIRHNSKTLSGNEWVLTVDRPVSLDIEMRLLTNAAVCATHFDVERDGPSGNIVRVLFREETERSAGHLFQITWDGRDGHNRRVPAGRYHLVSGLHSPAEGCDTFTGGWGFGLGYFNVPG